MGIGVASPPIVCGVDGSPDGALAARVAGRIAMLLDRPLTLVHAAPRPWVSERPFATYDERLQEQTAFDWGGYLHTILRPVEIAELVRVDHAVEWGAPAEALRSIAGRLEAELIVVGSRGQSPYEDVFLRDSTSTGLARDAPVPVVVAPPGIGDGDTGLPGGSVVCGVDGAELSLAAARAAGRLAVRLGLPLVLVGVDSESGDPAGDGELAAAAVAEAVPGVELRAERSRGPVAEELLAAAARHDAGLVAVGSRGRGPLTSALLGSVTTTLLRRSDRSVLVVSRGAADTGLSA